MDFEFNTRPSSTNLKSVDLKKIKSRVFYLKNFAFTRQAAPLNTYRLFTP